MSSHAVPTASTREDLLEHARLVDALSRPEAYPHPAPAVEVHQTHISVVFLAGAYAYKLKKPVRLPFLDFTALEQRQRFCREEVRLNRRLAPDVYLDVVPVVAGRGGVRVGGKGAPLDYLVRMVRLPAGATLLARIREPKALDAHLARLGRHLARFHGEAARGPEIARYARFDVVAGNAGDNLEQGREQVGVFADPAVMIRLERALERRLSALQPLIESRARAGIPRDTHGDLHLDHVYLFPDRPPPGDIVIVDCIEFNQRFRFADPVADLAFLSMDLAVHGRPDLDRVLVEAYRDASDAPVPPGLLALYRSYRAAVRAKVDGLLASDAQVAAGERAASRERARAHWLFALSELEPPKRRPALVGVGGLPGTGKSTVARGLARRAGFHVIASDRVRKELAGLAPDAPVPQALDRGIYTPDMSARTYRVCLERARALVSGGERVVVDATFGTDALRRDLLDLALGLGVRPRLLVCESPPETVQARLERRARNGGGQGRVRSDADWGIYRALRQRWEPPGEAVRRFLTVVDAGGPAGEAVARAHAALSSEGLAGPVRAGLQPAVG